MNSKIDIRNITELKEYFNTYSDPKKIIPLSEKENYDNFIYSLQLKDNSIFLTFLKSLINNFEYLKNISQTIDTSYSLWIQHYIKKTNKIPKAFKKILTNLHLNEISANSLLFCLETFFSVIMKIILVQTWNTHENPVHSNKNLVSDLEEFRVQEKENSTAWLLFFKNKLDKIKANFQKTVFEGDIFEWWISDLHSFKQLKVQESNNNNNNINGKLITLNDSLASIIIELVKYDFTAFYGDLIGDLYQDYFDKDSRKFLGEFYTPSAVVEYILDTVGYNSENILSKRLVDLSCGSGSFLIKALKRYLANAEKRFISGRRHYWSETIQDLCSQYRIIGLDIHPFAVYMSQIQFIHTIIPYYRKALQENTKFKIESLPIFKTDSLLGNISENIKENLTFDYVVGNPPYINIRKINSSKKSYYEEKYYTAKGSYDIYCLFIEKGLSKLTGDGKLAFITSNQFLTSDYGLYLRKYLRNNSDQNNLNIKLEELIDFRDSKIFPDVTAYPCIIVLSKPLLTLQSNNYKFIGVRVAKKIENAFELIKKFKESNSSEFLTSDIDLFKMNSKYLRDDIWTIMPNSEREVFELILNKSDANLEDITENIFVGTQTSLDKIYLVKIVSEINDHTVSIKPILDTALCFDIEKSILKPILKGKDVSKWTIDWTQHWLVFPYDNFNKSKVIKVKELKKEFPLTMKYFDYFSAEIKGREHGLMKNKDEWYAYIYPKNHLLFEQPKLISQLLSKSNRFSFDQTGEYYFVAVGGNCLTFKNKYSDNDTMTYLLGMLNSSLLTFMLKHWSPVHEGGFYLYIYNFIKRLPLIINATDDNVKNELISTVKDTLEIKKVYQKDQDLTNLSKISEKEKHLDELVFKIFNLSQESINIVQRFNEKY